MEVLNTSQDIEYAFCTGCEYCEVSVNARKACSQHQADAGRGHNAIIVRGDFIGLMVGIRAQRAKDIAQVQVQSGALTKDPQDVDFGFSKIK